MTHTQPVFWRPYGLALGFWSLTLGCARVSVPSEPVDAGSRPDASRVETDASSEPTADAALGSDDAGDDAAVAVDAALVVDAARPSLPDAARSLLDASRVDAATVTMHDAGTPDAGNDAGPPDAGADAGPSDAGPPDASTWCTLGSCAPPSITADLLLWLAADAITGVADGAPVASWPDATDHHYDATQAMTAAQPTFAASAVNGRPAVRFDGTDDYLDTPTVTLFATSSSSVTIFAVFKANHPESGQRFLLTNYQENCASNLELGYHTGNGDRANFGLHRGCSNATVITDNLTADWHLFTTEALEAGTAPENVRIWQSSSPQTLENNAAGWVSAGSYGTASRILSIGARHFPLHPALDSFHDGDIAEILVYDTALDDAARLPIETYLRAKYGLP